MDKVSLRAGDRGDKVKELNTMLKSLGYLNRQITDEFGRNTRSAVSALQNDLGLRVNGMVDDKTWQVIGKAYAGGKEEEPIVQAAAPAADPAAVSPPPPAATRPAPPPPAGNRRNSFRPPRDKSIIREGSRGAYVAELQNSLRRMGYYSGKLDGYFGPITKAAVEAYQLENGLKVDGIVGPMTWQSIRTQPADKFIRPFPPDDSIPVPATKEQGFKTPMPAVAAVPSARPVLRRGSAGDAVNRLQLILARLEFFDGTVDGYFGPVTEAAVMKFQKDAGLESNGIVEDNTWKALEERAVTADPALAKYFEPGGNPYTDLNLIAGQYPLIRPGDSNHHVRELQKVLLQLKLYNNHINGIYDEDTQRAIMDFQAENGLRVDGIVGPQTWTALEMQRWRAIMPDDILPYPDEAQPGAGLTSGAEDPVLRLGDSGEAVMKLQQDLHDLGFYSGMNGEEFDSSVEDAVKAFQDSAGLEPTGVVDADTWFRIDSLVRLSGS